MRYFTNDVLTFGFVDEFEASMHFEGSEIRELFGEELDRFLNPENYLTDEEKLKLTRSRMPDLTPIKFDIKLRKNGLLKTIRDYVASNEVMEIAYTRATFFSRTDPFIDQARIALNLTDEQVDEMWTS